MTEVKKKKSSNTSNSCVTAKCIYQLNSGVITTYLSLSFALILSRNFISFLTPYQNISWMFFCTAAKCQDRCDTYSLFYNKQLGKRQKSKPFT